MNFPSERSDVDFRNKYEREAASPIRGSV